METINPQEWKQDLPAFKEKTDQFYAGELSKADYKDFPVVTEVMHRKMGKQV